MEKEETIFDQEPDYEIEIMPVLTTQTDSMYVSLWRTSGILPGHHEPIAYQLRLGDRTIFESDSSLEAPIGANMRRIVCDLMSFLTCQPGDVEPVCGVSAHAPGCVRADGTHALCGFYVCPT